MSAAQIQNERKQRIVVDSNAVANVYDEAPYFLQTTTARLIELAQLRAGMRVLDVATGAGLSAIVAALIVGRQGCVVGIDLAPPQLDCARRKLAAFDLPQIELREMDAECLDFADESFDAVVCASSLYFMADMAAAVREWRRVLVEDGRVAFSAYAPAFMQPLHDIWVARLKRHGVTMEPLATRRLPDEATCARLLHDAGFTDIDVRTEQLGYYQTPEQRWKQLSSGLEGMVLASFAPPEREQIKREHLAELQQLASASGLWFDVPAILALGR
jgi:ubiquinone/menaquinone biosynthesis C-methylase UbiE